MGESKICIIHGAGHCSDECKGLGDFGAKYTKGDLTKDRGNYPLTINKFTRQKENNDIVNNAVNEILPHETQKLISVKVSPGVLESEYDEN